MGTIRRGPGAAGLQRRILNVCKQWRRRALAAHQADPTVSGFAVALPLTPAP